MKISHFISIAFLLAGLCRAGEPSLKLLAAEAEPAAKITAPAKARRPPNIAKIGSHTCSSSPYWSQ